MKMDLQFFGGRGAGASNRGGQTARYNASNDPIGTRKSMGNWKFTKTGPNTWRAFRDGRRQSNRTDADINRVFR